MIIKVNDCYFLVDFLIQDMTLPLELNYTRIIFKCPFLVTAKADKNCEIGLIDMFFGDKTVKMNLFKAHKFPKWEDSCWLGINNFGEVYDGDENFELRSLDETNVDGAIRVFDPGTLKIQDFKASQNSTVSKQGLTPYIKHMKNLKIESFEWDDHG